MTQRRHLLLPLAALLGAAVGVLPAVAVSETGQTIEAENSSGAYGEQHHAWKPAEVTLGAAGVVTLSNPTSVSHGVQWIGGPERPSCSAGVPVGTTPAAAAGHWSGTCTFSKPGEYVFYCTVHGAEMTGRITVNASGTTTTTTPSGTTTTGTTTTGTTTAGTTTTSAPGSTTTSGSTGAGSRVGSGGSTGSPLAGGASSAIRLPTSQHGRVVRGSVEVSNNGAGGRLEVELLAKRASLASARHASQVQVGRIARSSLRAGAVAFAVPLDAAARRALRAHRRLVLTARIRLIPSHGTAVSVTRGVVVHA